MVKIVTVEKERLSEKDQIWLAMIVNSFGTGDHPYVEKENLEGCALNYAVDCCGRAYGSCVKSMTLDKAEIADRIKRILEEQVI